MVNKQKNDRRENSAEKATTKKHMFGGLKAGWFPTKNKQADKATGSSKKNSPQEQKAT